MISQYGVYGGLSSFSLDKCSEGSRFGERTANVVLDNPELTVPEDVDDCIYKFYWEAYFADFGVQGADFLKA